MTWNIVLESSFLFFSFFFLDHDSRWSQISPFVFHGRINTQHKGQQMFIFVSTITLISVNSICRRKKRGLFCASFLSVSIPTEWGLAAVVGVNGTER